MNKRILEKKFNTIALSVSIVMLASTVLLSPVSAQQIVIDGKTQTTLSTNGNVTDVRTQTISGVNAYNSFKKFNVDKDNTVNLHLPGSTKNLVNLIYDEKTNINGILNSIKNGQIGGNVVLVNPHGMTVGTQGVVNVGSLTAVSPPFDEMERFRIDSDEAQNVNFKNMRNNPESVIEIKGQVNAATDIYLSAGTVNVSGKLEAGKTFKNIEKNETDEIISFFNPYKPQGVSFGEIVNVGPSLYQPTVTLQNIAGNVEILSAKSISIQNGELLANNGSLKLFAYGGDVSGYGDFKGELSAFGDEIDLINTKGDIDIQLLQSSNGRLALWSYGSILPTTASYGFMANDIFLSSLTGDIGKKNDPLLLYNMHNTPTKIETSSLRGSTYLRNIGNEDLHVKKLEAYDTVKIETNGNIFNGNTNKSLHNIEADKVILSSINGSIGKYVDPLKIKPSGLGQHYSSDTSILVNASAQNEIILEQDRFNMKADTIESLNGDVWLTARNGSILDGSTYEGANVKGEYIALKSQYGSVGTKNDDLNIQVTKPTGTLDVIAYDGDVNVAQDSGDLPVGLIMSNYDVKISSYGSILDGYKYELPSITCKNLVLKSDNGSIGSFNDDLDIQSNRFNSGGSLTAIAPNGMINIQQHSYDLNIKSVHAGGDVYIKSQYGIFSDLPYSNIDIIGNNIYLDAGTSIGTYNDPLGVKNKGHIKAFSNKDKYITIF